jgi:hypothetical protein
VQAGYDFSDISNPREPKELGFVLTRPDGATHGFEIDHRYVYGCANAPESKAESGRRARVTPPAISKIGDSNEPSRANRHRTEDPGFEVCVKT